MCIIVTLSGAGLKPERVLVCLSSSPAQVGQLLQALEKIMSSLKKHQAPTASEPEEKVGVARIKIRQKKMRLTAVLGEFLEVDRLLRSWRLRAGEPVGPDESIECEFEVTFLDGFRFQGIYEFGSKKSRRPSLIHFLRSCMEAGTSGLHAGNFNSGRKKFFDLEGNAVNPLLLDRYDIQQAARSIC